MFQNMGQHLTSELAQLVYVAIVEVVVLVVYMVLARRLSRVMNRFKDSISGYFELDEFKKDEQIKRFCIEALGTIQCCNIMIFRLHNGESAGSHYSFKRISALFDEPRRGNKLLLPEWQNISYSIFSYHIEKLFEQQASHRAILGISDDNSYRAFHLNKGVYYEILVPVYVYKEHKKYPFGYIGAFFNYEQAQLLQAHPSSIQYKMQALKKLRDEVELVLAMGIKEKPKIPEIFGLFGVN